MTTDRDRLWEAFQAGFDASGEGFNGEVVGPKMLEMTPDGTRAEETLRERFELWLAQRDVPA